MRAAEDLRRGRQVAVNTCDLGSATASRVLDRSAAVETNLTLLPTTTTQAPSSPEPIETMSPSGMETEEDKEKDEEDDD